jgi:hypothetical protein
MQVDAVCGTCYYWIPLRSNPSIGLCILNKLVKGVNDKGSTCYKMCKPSKFEYMWCKDCDVIVSRDDVEDHIFHVLHAPPHLDEDAHEETYFAS